MPSPHLRQSIPGLTTTPTKRKLQDLQNDSPAKFQKFPTAKPIKTPKPFKSFIKLDGRLQLITTIELGIKITSRPSNFKDSRRKNPAQRKFKFKPEIETLDCLTPRSKILRSAKLTQQAPKLKFKLKKTETAKKKIKKQEEEDEDKETEERKEEKSIPKRSSSRAEVEQKAGNSKPPIEQSTKSLVNFFENLDRNKTSSSPPVEAIQILGGKTFTPITSSVANEQQSDWADRILCSGNTILEGRKQRRQED